jgi:hypothetical protein
MSITRVEAQSNIAGSTTPAFTNAFAVGDVIVVFGNYFPTAPAPGCTDSLGNIYSIVHNSGALYAVGPEVIFKTVVTVAGAAPTVSLTGANSGHINAHHYTGFTGVPTFLNGSDFVEATGTGTAVSTSTFPVSHTGELLVGISSDTGGTHQPDPTDLSIVAGNFQLATYDSLSAHPSGLTAGATVGWNTTLTASDNWYAAILGIYDAPATGATLTAAGQDIATATGALSTAPAPFAPILLNDPAHRGGSSAIGMGNGIPGSNTGDTAPVAFTKLIQSFADINTMVSQLYPVRSKQTPTTAFSIAVSPGITQLRLTPAGTLATGTITFPPTPGDQQPFTAMTSQTVTALAVNTSDGTTINGAPTTLAANSSIKWIFEADLNTWFRQN